MDTIRRHAPYYCFPAYISLVDDYVEKGDVLGIKKKAFHETMVQMTVQGPDVQLGMIKKGYCVLSDE